MGPSGVDCAGASSAVSREGSPGPLGICRNPRASSPRPSSALLTRRRCRSPRSRPSEGRGQRLAESAPRLGRSVLNAPKPSTHPGFVKRRSPHAGSRALPHRNDPLIVTGGRSRRRETRGGQKSPRRTHDFGNLLTLGVPGFSLPRLEDERPSTARGQRAAMPRPAGGPLPSVPSPPRATRALTPSAIASRTLTPPGAGRGPRMQSEWEWAPPSTGTQGRGGGAGGGTGGQRPWERSPRRHAANSCRMTAGAQMPACPARKPHGN